jgi:hypothetical protein
MRSRRGVIDPVTLSVLCALALGYVLGGWKPMAMFKKEPDTKKLTEMQAKLEVQQVAAASALAAVEASKKEERERLEAQVRSAQLDNEGTVAALSAIKPTQQSMETRLAAKMAQRVSLKLATAIGKLPSEQQEAMIELIQQALSDKQEEVDAANAKLAALDADFKAITAKRDELLVQIPILEANAAKSNAIALKTQAEVKAKTEEVKTWAEKTNAALKENGSLSSNLEKLVLWAVGGYLFFTIILPGIVKHLASDNPLKGTLRNISGYLTSPMLFHDAKAKIEEALYTEPPPK